MRTTLFDLHRLSWVAFMAALIAAGAFVQVAIGPVPITFQDMAAALAGLALGPRYGVYAMALYLLAGVAGLPVFSGGRAGLGHLAGPTGGYLVGFLFLAFWAGLGGSLAKGMLRKKNTQNADTSYPAHAAKASMEAGPRRFGRSVPSGAQFSALACALLCVVAGMACVYACGAGWLMYSLDLSLERALAVGILPFLPLGLPKSVLAVLVWQRLLQRRLLPE